MGVMERLNLDEQEGGGKLVALEGDIDTIATQLRLLPPSQKILVLPSFVDSLPPRSAQYPFDARAFIRDVYLAFAERTDTAQSFLKYSSPSQPRVVFMNGGSVCARSSCILKISENITNGDVYEAELVFNEIAQHGVANILAQDATDDELETLKVNGAEDHGEELELGETDSRRSLEVGRPENLTLKPKTTTDELEREAVAIQSKIDSFQEVYHTPQQHSSDPAIPGTANDIPELQPNSSEQPSHQYSSLTKTNGLLVGTNQADKAGEMGSTTRDSLCFLDSRSHHGRRHSFAETRKSYFFEDNLEDGDFDEDDGLFSLSPTPGVIFGEAELVDMHTGSTEKELRRVKSADTIYTSISSWPKMTQSIPAFLRHTTSAFLLGRPVSSVGFGAQSFQTLPKRTFTRASQTTIKRSPPPTRTPSTIYENDGQATGPTLVDRGTATADDIIDEDQYDEDEYEEYIPIFPLVEDLVIQFTDSSRNPVLDSVIRSYRDGSYPLPPPSTETISSRSSSLPLQENLARAEDTCGSSGGKNPGHSSPVPSPVQSEVDDPGYESRHSYDPYSSDNRPLSGMDVKLAPPGRLARADSGVQMPDPPSPKFSITTPPNEPIDKFIELSTVDSTGTIFLQDSLRRLFSIHLPAGDPGYRQHNFTVSPEADRLWKPVFKNDETSSVNSESNTVDQIICLGCETGVRKEFFNQISGHIERLGMKKDGVSRSAKLDITYLIANMMQTYCALPLTVQSTFNPLSDPTILATLLVPQIEAYLACNATTRLLILHYPISHLPTIFALRQLLGVETLKIAGILNTLASDPPSSVTSPRTPLSKYNSNSYLGEPTSPLRQKASQAGSLRSTNRKDSFVGGSPTPGGLHRYASERKLSSTAISFSKANHLLPSTATDTEITTFLSGIWKCLIDKSSFYAPEPSPEPMIVERLLSSSSPPMSLVYKARDAPTSRAGTPTRQQPTAERAPAREREHNYLPSSFRSPTISSTTSSAVACEGKNYRLTGSTKVGTYAASITNTKTNGSEKKRRAADGSWENFYIGDEDSDDDEYDKMTLGRQHAKIVPEIRKSGHATASGPKRNKQKALKWLGLA